MSTIKRTSDINSSFFKKNSFYILAPVAGAVFVALGYAIFNKDASGTVYRDAESCVQANPGQAQACQTAFNNAKLDAEKTGPKYASLADCEAEFGEGMCRTGETTSENSSHYRSNSWTPMMVGYLMGSHSSGQRNYAPMFSSMNKGHPAYGKFVDATGNTVGDGVYNKQMKVKESAFAPKPATTKTITRGGFGQSVAKTTAMRSSSSSSSVRSSGG